MSQSCHSCNSWLLSGIKSTNGGDSWNPANSGLPQNQALTTPSSPLVLDPISPDTLYFAPDNGFYKTTDGGDNWKSLNPPIYGPENILAMSKPTASSSFLYFAAATTIYRSTDGACSWTSVSAAYAALGGGVSALALVDGDPGRLYAGMIVPIDGFVARLDPSGSYLQFSTYLGGASCDYLQGIATDSAGNSYVSGATSSLNFPITQGSFQQTMKYVDAFLVKISRALKTPGDFEGSGKNNLAVFRPNSGIWYSLSNVSPGSYNSTLWGVSADHPVPGDYDGDGKTDYAVWRPDSGVWYILLSGTPGSYRSLQWGLTGDLPVPGDYDGDGKTDIAVWRPDSGVWYVLRSGTPGSYLATAWGMNGDTPISSLATILRAMP
jgi:hypothetical protein